jgi:GNAT superfamily N-acetyltransferase
VATLDAQGPADRIVAEQDGDLLGSVLLYPPAAKAYGSAGLSVAWPEVRLLAVVPAARGHGVGKALMEECIRRARGAGASALGLHTMDIMQAAMRMYEGMGFVRVPDNDFTPVPGVVVKGYRLDLVHIDRLAD